MMHGEMWWMPLMMWGPLALLLVLAGAVGYLWARRDPGPSSAASKDTTETAAPPSSEAPPPSPEPPSSLSGTERVIYELVVDGDEVLQKDLPERTGSSKATVSRALDRLERRGLVQRVSHGMTNRVVPGEGTRS